MAGVAVLVLDGSVLGALGNGAVLGASGKDELFKDEEVLGASTEATLVDLTELVAEPLVAFPRASLIICWAFWEYSPA